MDKPITSFDKFAQIYDQVMGDTGDYTHQNTIDPALFKAIGDFKGKVIYDIGCGNGYISRKLAKEGAKEVWASDVSEKLILFAQNKYKSPVNIKYFITDACNFNHLPKKNFDLVIMNMSLHYINTSRLDYFFKGVNLLLKNGGRFIFTADHPLRKLGIKGTKRRDFKFGEIIASVQNYLKIGKRIGSNIWTGEKNLIHYHAPLSFYINLLVNNGFFIDAFIEPETKSVLNDINNQTPIFTPIPTIYALGARKI